MNISPDQIIAWLIIGLLAGSLAGMLIKGQRKGFGWVVNLVIGLVGAVLGGALFSLLGINFNLPSITLSFDDVLAAFVGALLFLLLVGFVKRR